VEPSGGQGGGVRESSRRTRNCSHCGNKAGDSGTRKTQDKTDVCRFAVLPLSRNGTDQHEREEEAAAEAKARPFKYPPGFSRFSRKEGAWLRRNVPVGRLTITGGDRTDTTNKRGRMFALRT
jgi:hypothetical protein